MYHCGARILNTHRKYPEQLQDWQRIKVFVGRLRLQVICAPFERDRGYAECEDGCPILQVLIYIYLQIRTDIASQNSNEHIFNFNISTQNTILYVS